jgi:metal-sulfur cluster biosynthetic enzyme
MYMISLSSKTKKRKTQSESSDWGGTAVIEQEILDDLKSVYDPEIRINIVDLGLVYSVKLIEEGLVEVIMTLTAPACPMSDQIMNDVRQTCLKHPAVTNADVKIVWDPPWNRDMMSEEAKLSLGFF